MLHEPSQQMQLAPLSEPDRPLCAAATSPEDSASVAPSTPTTPMPSPFTHVADSPFVNQYRPAPSPFGDDLLQVNWALPWLVCCFCWPVGVRTGAESVSCITSEQEVCQAEVQLGPQIAVPGVSRSWTLLPVRERWPH